MENVITCIPVDQNGNKLWIKDLRINDNRYFAKYKSTLNDMPFIETEIFQIENNFVITGDDGTILYRFSKNWLTFLNK